jgi:hypothetical protein
MQVCEINGEGAYIALKNCPRAFPISYRIYFMASGSLQTASKITNIALAQND